ncbi:MAG: hypothetical protein SWH61_03225 [Thermodesulfobacteriota bacterium]|nr:hypothetical protein [Thermodesulfobacteriota bacterium]
MREYALPLNYNLSTLGTDFDTIQDWNANRVEGVDLVGNMAGEVLYIPPGTYSDLTPVSLDPSNTPQTFNDDYFPLIIGEPDNKPFLQFSGPTVEVGLAVSSEHGTRICDLGIDIETEVSLDMVTGIFYTVPSAPVYGCVVRNLIAPNISWIASGFASMTTARWINCAIDARGTVIAGGINTVGFLALTEAHVNNLTLTHSDYTIGVMSFPGVTTYAKNCVIQNINYPTYGAVNQTTCAINQGLLFDTDGYTLLTDDRGNGTDLSSDPTCPFSDDIFGSARSPGQWERGASIYSEVTHTASRSYLGQPSKLVHPSLAQTVNVNMSNRIKRTR